MVTISRIRTKHGFGASIRWKILLAFFVIVALSFGVAATNLTGLVRDYLFEQRTREDSLLTEKAAAAAAPFFDSADAGEISRVLRENAQSIDGRLILVDQDGKVQYDTLRELNGHRLQLDEVLTVLNGSAEQAYGIHSPGEPDTEKMGGTEYSGQVAYSVHAIDGKDVKLTAKEFDLLQMFVTNRGTVFSREQMLGTVWKYDYAGDARTVDVHIRRLREKIERDAAKPEFIFTKWGVGYYFTDQD